MELDNPMTGQLPDDGSMPVEELPIVRGYSCRACRFHTISPKVAEQHWRTAGHASQGGRTPQGSKYVAAQLQTWLGGKYAWYWAVRNDDADDEERSAGDSVLESMITECEAEQKAEDDSRRRKGDAKEGLDRDDAWVSHMGWVRHFGSRDKLAIFDAAEWVRARAVKKQAVQGPELSARDHEQHHHGRTTMDAAFNYAIHSSPKARLCSTCRSAAYCSVECH
ncbi:hypothetical protein PLICBS_010131 [Purpureocillium lilacinum]|uniref:uncharacterized protein n=1 Tax=Purpureocillium lilacinum TaxID=33203 RepID=UPI002089168C|nr:hypothetical protein PLICBS_010131 [Purpureocillium lilacinum]